MYKFVIKLNGKIYTNPTLVDGQPTIITPLPFIGHSKIREIGKISNLKNIYKK
jgi:hypothetical protein